jgi:hypothetical protein
MSASPATKKKPKPGPMSELPWINSKETASIDFTQWPWTRQFLGAKLEVCTECGNKAIAYHNHLGKETLYIHQGSAAWDEKLGGYTKIEKSCSTKTKMGRTA